MFSEEYDNIVDMASQALSIDVIPSLDRTLELLQKTKREPLEFPEIAELLAIGHPGAKSPQFDCLRQFTNETFRRRFRSRLRHIAPVYISSHCMDSCSYCNFSAETQGITRTRLSASQLREEVDEVYSLGNRVIELTLASDPYFTAERLAEFISIVREVIGDEPGSGVLLCSAHLSPNNYPLLKDAGLWGVVQWDETLDENSYSSWHGEAGTKRHFRERIDTHDHAIKAGLEVATGTLFGLSDFRFDVLMQIGKARYLQRQYGKKPFVFGTPRIKPDDLHSECTSPGVLNLAFETALMVYKIAEPSISRWLQTREKLEFNLRNAVHDDVFTYNCGNVSPGGYKVHVGERGSDYSSQFRVFEQEKAQFERAAADEGFIVDYRWIPEGAQKTQQAGGPY